MSENCNQLIVVFLRKFGNLKDFLVGESWSPRFINRIIRVIAGIASNEPRARGSSMSRDAVLPGQPGVRFLATFGCARKNGTGPTADQLRRIAGQHIGRQRHQTPLDTVLTEGSFVWSADRVRDGKIVSTQCTFFKTGHDFHSELASITPALSIRRKFTVFGRFFHDRWMFRSGLTLFCR